MTVLHILPQLADSHKAGPGRQQPAQCRPRHSEADIQRQQQSGEPTLDPRVAKVQDHLATRLRKEPQPRGRSQPVPLPTQASLRLDGAHKERSGDPDRRAANSWTAIRITFRSLPMSIGRERSPCTTAPRLVPPRGSPVDPRTPLSQINHSGLVRDQL